MRAGPEAAQSLVSATRSFTWANMRGTTLTREVARIRSARKSRMPLDRTICTATFGSGAKIGMGITRATRQIPKVPNQARTESTGAGAGSTPPRTAGLRSARGTPRRGRTPSWQNTIVGFRVTSVRPGK